MVQDLLFLGVSNSLLHADFPSHHFHEFIISHFRATCLALQWRNYIFTGCIWRKELPNIVITASKLSLQFILNTAPVSRFHFSYWLRRNTNLYILPLAFEGTPAYITLNLSAPTHCNTEEGGNKFLRRTSYMVH
jgi:hypothetical protein